MIGAAIGYNVLNRPRLALAIEFIGSGRPWRLGRRHRHRVMTVRCGVRRGAAQDPGRAASAPTTWRCAASSQECCWSCGCWGTGDLRDPMDRAAQAVMHLRRPPSRWKPTVLAAQWRKSGRRSRVLYRLRGPGRKRRPAHAGWRAGPGRADRGRRHGAPASDRRVLDIEQPSGKRSSPKARGRARRQAPAAVSRRAGKRGGRALHAKDLARAIAAGGPDKVDIAAVATEPWFVPSKPPT